MNSQQTYATGIGYMAHAGKSSFAGRQHIRREERITEVGPMFVRRLYKVS
jgi:hypothetical protein